MLAGEVQAVPEDFGPEVFRDVGIVHEPRPADAAQIEPDVRGAAVFVFIAPLLQGLHNGVGRRNVLAHLNGKGLLRQAHAHGGDVQDHIGRADDVAGVHKAVDDAVGHIAGVALAVPGPDGDGVGLAVAGEGVGEAKLVLEHRVSGGLKDPLAVQVYLDIALRQGAAGVGGGLHRQGEVAVGGFGDAL